MGNSQRREARRSGDSGRLGHRRDRERDRADRGRDAERPTGDGSRQRSSTQPTRHQRTPPPRPAGNGTNNAVRQPIPQWVTANNYTQPVAAELQESKSIKNHANLNKPSLALVPARDGRFRIKFRADCRVETEVCVYLATRETPNPDNAGVRFEPQHQRFANAVLPTQKLPAETDCTYTSPSINVRNYWKYLRYRPHQPHDYPIVIAMSYRISDAEWEDLKAQSKEEPKEEKEEDAEGLPMPESRIQSQFTYAEVVRQANDEKPTEYTLKVLKQRLQVGNDLYDLEDIYGMPAESTASAATAEAHTNEPVTASLAGLADHDDGEDCVICLAEPRNTLVMPCRHMCLCSDCASMLRQRTNKCPICRTVAERFLTFKKNKEEDHDHEHDHDHDGDHKDSDSEDEVDFNMTPDAVAAGGGNRNRVRSSSASSAPISSAPSSGPASTPVPSVPPVSMGPSSSASGPTRPVSTPSPRPGAGPQGGARRTGNPSGANRPIQHY